MSAYDCGEARLRIPESVEGSLPAAEARALESHLATCGECRAEADLVRLLRAGRPEAPAGLADRIAAAAVGHTQRAAPTRAARPWWGLAAAAVAALALGVGLRAGGGGDEALAPFVTEAALTGAAELWVAEDGEVAGAPLLDDLSDEDLVVLLNELGSGGAA